MSETPEKRVNDPVGSWFCPCGVAVPTSCLVICERTYAGRLVHVFLEDAEWELHKMDCVNWEEVT